ncbi:MAG: hypothetical protein LBH25_06400 [Fibromonadaceae bacterium]|jgi:hypothetical protein|nr:hypothetical protein [Fibromonadaceae bacterium]
MINTSDILGNSLASMDSLWKNGRGGQDALIEESFQPKMPSVPKAVQAQPDWNSIPSKNVRMSEEEFEEAIRALALGSMGKSALEVEKERAKLLMEYVSVASPDRKAAYEKFDGRSDVVYGDSNQKLLSRSPYGKWNCESLTKEEQARVAKFNGIYINAIKEYEAEHGQSSYTASAKTTYNLYSQWAGNSYSSLYNAFA